MANGLRDFATLEREGLRPDQVKLGKALWPLGPDRKDPYLGPWLLKKPSPNPDGLVSQISNLYWSLSFPEGGIDGQHFTEMANSVMHLKRRWGRHAITALPLAFKEVIAFGRALKDARDADPGFLGDAVTINADDLLLAKAWGGRSYVKRANRSFAEFSSGDDEVGVGHSTPKEQSAYAAEVQAILDEVLQRRVYKFPKEALRWHRNLMDLIKAIDERPQQGPIVLRHETSEELAANKVRKIVSRIYGSDGTTEKVAGLFQGYSPPSSTSQERAVYVERAHKFVGVWVNLWNFMQQENINNPALLVDSLISFIAAVPRIHAELYRVQMPETRLYQRPMKLTRKGFPLS